MHVGKIVFIAGLLQDAVSELPDTSESDDELLFYKLNSSLFRELLVRKLR